MNGHTDISYEQATPSSTTDECKCAQSLASATSYEVNHTMEIGPLSLLMKKKKKKKKKTPQFELWLLEEPRKSNFLYNLLAATAKSLQLCPTLCDLIDSSPPGSPISGILQARTLEWVAISFSNAWKWKVKVKSLSCVRRFATPWTAAYQAPPPMGFSRQEYWSRVPLPSPTC